MEKIKKCVSVLTGQKEVLRFQHKEMEVAKILLKSFALLPKPVPAFLEHKKKKKNE